MKNTRTNFEKIIYRNVYKMPSGRLYSPMNVYDSVEDALQMARDQHGDQYAYTYSITIWVHAVNDEVK